MRGQILAATILVAAAVLLAFGLQRIRRESASLRALGDALQREAAQLVEATAHAAITTAAAPTKPAPSAAAIENKKPLPPGALAVYSDRNVMGEPEYAATIARRHRRYAMANFRRVIGAMELSAADTAQLKELVAAKWLAREDAGDVLDRMGDATPDLRRKASAAAQAEAEEKVKALLGPERYAEYRIAQDVATTEQVNWPLFTDFWDAGMPLSSDQKTALARTLVALRAEYPAGTDTPVDPQTGLRPEVLQLLATASSFLTPAQLDLLRDRKLEHAQYDQLRRAKKSAADAPAPKSQ